MHTKHSIHLTREGRHNPLATSSLIVVLSVRVDEIELLFSWKLHWVILSDVVPAIFLRSIQCPEKPSSFQYYCCYAIAHILLITRLGFFLVVVVLFALILR